MFRSLLGLIALAAGSAVCEPREDAADQAAFQVVCGSCHNISLVAGIRTESEWIEEIQHMVKIGAKGTDEQFDRVMRVLLAR